MEESIGHGAAPSRRDFLSTTGAALAAAVLPSGSAVAQSPAKHCRVNVSSPEAGQVLASYKKAIRAMLALPPSDPRNWYRQSLVHTLDCPHGNWWFLVWHRGYVGWFEQICRELSGDPQFALP
jgi:tyrosinase